MGKLIYTALCSLDGFVADLEGTFDWAAPDDAVHAFVNERERAIGTMLHGRRMYQVMAAWQTLGTDPDEPEIVRDSGEIWRAADKIVFSRTLREVTTPRTHLETDFDTERIGALVQAAKHDVSIGGSHLAAEALRAGLVDEVQLYLNPIVIGAGNPALPADVRIPLLLIEEHRFGSGVVYLRYQVQRS